MSSAARKVFIGGINALQTSINTPLVTGPDTVGSFLRRGLQVVGYGLLETFIVDRLNELSGHMNDGMSHVSDLPEKLRKAAFQDILRVAADKVQWAGPGLPDAVAFTSALGRSLIASSGPIHLSPLTWQWRGSNMGIADLNDMLRLFHVQAPWQTLTNISLRADFPVTDAKAAVTNLLQERNSSAHDSGHQVSNLIARAAPAQLLALGFSTDVLISLAAHQIRLASQEYWRDTNWLNSDKLKFRFVRFRTKEWAEVLEGRSKAARLNHDRDAASKSAFSASLGKLEVVVFQNSARQVLDWTYPDAP